MDVVESIISDTDWVETCSWRGIVSKVCSPLLLSCCCRCQGLINWPSSDTTRKGGKLGHATMGHSAESVGQLRQLWHSRFTTLWPCDRSITVSPLYNGRKCDTGQLQTPPDHWPTPTRAQPFTIEIDRYYLVDHIGVSIARDSG